MKKTTIFLATTLIIAVLVCGAVSADNTNTGTSSTPKATSVNSVAPAASSVTAVLHRPQLKLVL